MRELEVALELAREAGEAVLASFGRGVSVERKDGDEPVTEVDRAADALVRRGLIAAFPDDAILSEETPDDLERLKHRRLWLVDPLDGTQQYVDGVAEFAVMIGLAVEGLPVVGVVHLPAERESFIAARGVGCFRVDGHGRREPVRVSQDPPDERGPMLVVSRSHYGRRTAEVVERLSPRRLLRSGSVGRKAVMVARGEADAYFTLGQQSSHWDACAPDVVVREAGGVFLDGAGERITYNTAEIRNTNGLIACRETVAQRVITAVSEAAR
jgi:3'(2'),5'-bisphosphate nucleotidase